MRLLNRPLQQLALTSFVALAAAGTAPLGAQPPAHEHQVAASGSATFTYDANGNRTSKLQDGVLWTYIYDARDLLVEVRRDGVLVERYHYDAERRRIRKAGSGQLIRYVWDGDRVLLETDDFGNTIARYTYGADRLLSIEHAAEGRGFYLFDGTGSPAGIVRTDGALRVRYEWDAWGNLRRSAGDSANPFGFTSHQLDEPTGLYYAGARYYDPELGIFLTEDPLLGDTETPSSLHRYLYAYANPAVYWDPDGLESIRQWFDIEGDLMADRVAVGAAKYTLYQAWNALSFGFLSEHDEVFETSSGGQYAVRTTLALGKAGTRAYVAAQTGGAGLAFSEAAGLGTVATTTLTGAAVGFTQTATDDVFNVVEGKPTHSARDYVVNTAAGGAIGALSGGLVRTPAPPMSGPAPSAVVAPSAEASAIRARVLDNIAESQSARASSGYANYARSNTGIVVESASGPSARVVPVAAAAPLGSAPPYQPRVIAAELQARYPGQVETHTLAPPGTANANRQLHPAGIMIDERGFPVFDDVAVFDTRLASSIARVPNRRLHFQESTRALADAQLRGEVPFSLFTPEQRLAIGMGAEKIPGHTWHHHQLFGRMQLVPTPIHRAVGHTGGFRLWY